MHQLERQSFAQKSKCGQQGRNNRFLIVFMVRPERFELPTY
jgi:hypothetical protein